MKILVTGEGGMLATAVVAELRDRNIRYHALNHNQLPIDQRAKVAVWLNSHMPAAVINCAGRIPKSGTDIEIVLSNTVGPHVLARECVVRNIRLIHISTDCVFSGIPNGNNGRRYNIKNLPDPIDLYGRSKLAGESLDWQDHILIIRTSFIGEQSGLLSWLLKQEGEIEGWMNYYWTGSTIKEIAKLLVDEALEPKHFGVHHAAIPEKISKGQLIQELARRFSLPVEVVPSLEPHIDRALEPTIELPSIWKSIDKLL